MLQFKNNSNFLINGTPASEKHSEKTSVVEGKRSGIFSYYFKLFVPVVVVPVDDDVRSEVFYDSIARVIEWHKVYP